ncbi:FMN-linked oxidoreductase [Aspergillus taichungensis]|uniref:FMN-linked oxidoreductase n=1 Tax=Aspergillus taichungensis TaxID=482145 RepID=A0A2J5HTG5_9EURO|nr:FMN-linked oxidoreductase [Aspergillus taichungensis]
MGSIAPSVVRAPETPYFTPDNHDVGAALNPNDPSTPTLFRPLTIRGVTLKNRIAVSPMCMYSAESDPNAPDVGALTDYHLAHLGQFALKGAGLVFVEAQGVEPRGRISPNDAGLWQHGTDSPQFRSLQRVVHFCRSQGAHVGIQLAHAGRKASVTAPWVARQHGRPSLRAEAAVGGWPDDVIGPSGGDDHRWDAAGDYWTPRAATVTEIQGIVRAFADSAACGVRAGVEVVEIHAAHGYLLHQFLSPVTNRRTDDYGGSFENRTRLLREVVAAVRAAVSEQTAVFVRISATEWLEGQPVEAEAGGSWDVASSEQLVPILADLGVDLIDVSSGGNHRDQRIPHGSVSYQTDLAGRLRRALRAAGRSTRIGAVGFITGADQARGLVEGSDDAERAAATVAGADPAADVVLLGRQFLREPEWVMLTAQRLGVKVGSPKQFWRAGGAFD